VTDRSGDMLFVMRNPAYVRNFESVLRALCERGQPITVLFNERKPGGERAGLEIVERLAREHTNLRIEMPSGLPLGLRGRLRAGLRMLRDYLRYFGPPLNDAGRLRGRAIAPLPQAVDRSVAAVLRRLPRVRRALDRHARALEQRLGEDPAIRAELDRLRPVALLVTPLVQFRCRQSDWVRSARVLGIPTMLCLHSWDNLTSKGLMHAVPDRIAVWNATQRDEAIKLHGARPESVVVTGAWPYEHWFRWEASRTREELFEQLGLPTDRAMILYTCSSRFIAEREPDAVARWLAALRSSDEVRLAEANVIVRPHPHNGDGWTSEPLRDAPGVAIFPAGGADPADDRSRADYFDSMIHADAIVGINTSALLESAIVGRPTLAFPAPEFQASQGELPHFRELAGAERMLRTSSSMAEHIDQLAETLADGDRNDETRRQFVERFIVPNRSERSPHESLVDEIESLVRDRYHAPHGTTG
jgi:hypothetical protein